MSISGRVPIRLSFRLRAQTTMFESGPSHDAAGRSFARSKSIGGAGAAALAWATSMIVIGCICAGFPHHCGELRAGRSGRVVEDDPQRMTPATVQGADAMAHRDAGIAPAAAHRALVHREDHRIALIEGNDIGA